MSYQGAGMGRRVVIELEDWCGPADLNVVLRAARMLPGVRRVTVRAPAAGPVPNVLGSNAAPAKGVDGAGAPAGSWRSRPPLL